MTKCQDCANIYVVNRMALLCECPMCNAKALKFYIKDGFKADFDVTKANQTTICPNCKRKISYSVQKKELK